MKRIYLLCAAVILAHLLTVMACKKEECPENHGAAHISLKTQMVAAGNYNVAFNFMGRKGHEEMLKGLDLKLDKADRFVLVTVMSKAERKLITDASVIVAVTSPSGTKSELTARPLMGGGMHHYVAGFMTPEKGDYVVEATVNAGGGKATAKATYRKE